MRIAVGAVALAALVAAARPAAAATKVALLVIGNNQPFSGGGGDPVQPVLRFADDDAAAFYELMAGIADSGHLLTVMDRDTQALYPSLAPATRAPTLAHLRAVADGLRKQIDENRRRGDRSVVYIFYSGHGALRDQDGPALALLDGAITQQFLYDEILGKLPADYVHLFVDACHAEAIVRPRDVEARHVPVAAPDAERFLLRSTLARFPHVGAIVAATGDTQAHEWDLLRQGVFTHELLSALRGAADVNHDGRIEYSEIYAFLAAANRSVGAPGARLTVVARPPDLDRHIAVLELSRLPASATARLVGVSADTGLVEVEDSSGRRIATLRTEPGYAADLVVPGPGPIYVRSRRREARIDVVPGRSARFETLTFRETGARGRGALEDAVRRGLFASEFGRGYYLGFIDQAPEFAPVSFATTTATKSAAATPSLDPSPIVPARVLVGFGASNTVADAFDVTPALRITTHPAADRGLALSLDVATAGAPGISEWRAMLSAGWIWSTQIGPAKVWLGAMVGGGGIRQEALGTANRWSGVVGLGPSSGMMLDFTRRIGVWGATDLNGLAYRRDGRTAFTLMPSVTAGVLIAL